jgi:hypothetical protein
MGHRTPLTWRANATQQRRQLLALRDRIAIADSVFGSDSAWWREILFDYQNSDALEIELDQQQLEHAAAAGFSGHQELLRSHEGEHVEPFEFEFSLKIVTAVNGGPQWVQGTSEAASARARRRPTADGLLGDNEVPAPTWGDDDGSGLWPCLSRHDAGRGRSPLLLASLVSGSPGAKASRANASPGAPAVGVSSVLALPRSDVITAHGGRVAVAGLRSRPPGWASRRAGRALRARGVTRAQRGSSRPRPHGSRG